MNSLSWLIYWAGVVGSLNTALAIATFGGAVLSVTFTIGIAWCNDFAADYAPSSKKWAKRCAAISVVALFISIPIPSTNTIYAIAASESGEKIATGETGKKAIKALDAWLDKQIKSDAK